MTKAVDPWQAMQRRLAAAVHAGTSGYPVARQKTPPHWRFSPAAGSWLDRTRSGVVRARETAA